MSMPPREEYLAPGFDPKILKVPQLRSVLLEYGIPHPSSAKKADLIELFTTQLVPRAGDILRQHARVQPSSHGIIAVSNSGVEAPVPPTTPATAKRPRGRPRKTATSASEELKPEGEDELSEPGPTAKKPRSRKTAPDADADADATAETPAPKKRGRPKKVKEEVIDVDSEMSLDEAVPKPPRKVRKSRSQTPETRAPAKEEPATAPATVPRKKKPKAAPVAAPAPKVEVDEAAKTPAPKNQRKSSFTGDSSPFSDFNPFQSGSEEAAERERRRRKSSIGFAVNKHEEQNKRKVPRPSEWTATSVPSGSILRKVGPSTENLRSPAPISPYAEEVAAAEAHNALVAQRMSGAQDDEEPQVVVTTSTELVERPKRKAIIRRKPKPTTPKTTMSLSLFTLLVFCLCLHYKSMSAANGFCDNDSYTNNVILGREGPIKAAQECISQKTQWQSDPNHAGEVVPFECNMQALPLVPFVPRPTECTPCPPNAICNNGEVTGCDSEFILKQSWLAPISPLLDGWPMMPSRVFGPSCKPDTVRMRQIGQLAKQMEKFLATRRGEFECTTSPKPGSTVGPGVRFGLPESELLELFAQQRVESISREDFEEMFESARGHLVAANFLVESIDEYGTSYFTSARSVQSLGCRVRLEMLRQLEEWRSQLTGLAVVLSVIGAGAYQLQSLESTRKHVREVTGVVLRRLQDQEYRHYTDPVQTPQPYLPPAQLRDVVLPASMSQAARNQIWSRVVAKVEENANVLVREREVRGDVWKTWEWNALGGRAIADSGAQPTVALALETGPPAF